jgi:hypothetical protein
MCAVLHRKAVRRRRRWRTHRRIRRETARVHRPGDPPALTAGWTAHTLASARTLGTAVKSQPAMAELSGLAGHRTESSSSAAMAPHRSDAGLSLPEGSHLRTRSTRCDTLADRLHDHDWPLTCWNAVRVMPCRARPLWRCAISASQGLYERRARNAEPEDATMWPSPTPPPGTYSKAIPSLEAADSTLDPQATITVPRLGAIRTLSCKNSTPMFVDVRRCSPPLSLGQSPTGVRANAGRAVDP